MGGDATSGRHYRRFDAFDRGLHLAMMCSFLGLAATGLPLLFSAAPWAGRLSRLAGGFTAAGSICLLGSRRGSGRRSPVFRHG